MLLHTKRFQSDTFARRILRLSSAVVIFAMISCNTSSEAQPDSDAVPIFEDAVPIFESEPHDAITLVASQGGGVFEVFPVDFPDGKKPSSPRPGERLTVRLLDEPERQYTIAWQYIEKLETFNELILNEARDLVQSGKYDEAFRYLAYLREEGPNVTNIDRVMALLLQGEAKAALSAGDMNAALSLLDELYRMNPGVKGLRRTITNVTNRLFDDYIKQRNYLAAKKMLTWAVDRFGRQAMSSTLEGWQKRLDERAAKRLQQAKQFLADGETRKAFDASREILQISTDLPGASQLFDDIAKQYVSLTIGVSRVANPNQTDGNDWASRRVRRLLKRSIAELSGLGPDGGLYTSPMATLQIGDDSRSMVIKIRRNLGVNTRDNSTGKPHSDRGGVGAGGIPIAERLLEYSRRPPPVAPMWAELMRTVDVQNVFDVHVELRRSFLRPEALLQFPWGSHTDTYAQPYLISDSNDTELFLRHNTDYLLGSADQPQDITERFVRSTAAAIQAITRGDIDIIERIYPADLDIVRSIPGITVEKYAIPSLHMLIPNFRRPHTGNRRFRRALAYGISRETLLGQDLMGNGQIDGSRQVSGPFPAGRFDDDSLGYGYDATIAPRPYEPRLAVTYSEIAHQELVHAAEKAGEPAPDRPKLRLLHPDDEIPRIASAGISQYLSAIGIECEAIPMPAGVSWPTNGNWDLVYFDNVMAEPILDAHRLLGGRGICGGGSSHLELALRQLAMADNWSEVRTRLHQIHGLARQEGAIIPLWQLTEHFAYSSRVTGIEPQPVSLYDDIESWRLQTSKSP